MSMSAYLCSKALTISTCPPLTAPISTVSPLYRFKTHKSEITTFTGDSEWPNFTHYTYSNPKQIPIGMKTE